MELLDKQAKGHARDEEVLQLFNALNQRMQQRSRIKDAVLHNQSVDAVKSAQHSKMVSSLPTDYSKKTQENEWMVSVQAGDEGPSSSSAIHGLAPLPHAQNSMRRRKSVVRAEKKRMSIARRLSVGHHGADQSVLRSVGAERQVRVRRRNSVLGRFTPIDKKDGHQARRAEGTRASQNIVPFGGKRK